ncbi:hypothetical protein ACSBR2_003294 [Camellia fascicularis]
MPNGSLNSWLHPIPSTGVHREPKSLNLLQRLNVAIDVASALDYLHNHCHTPIIHCDLKPSNILLDEYVTGSDLSTYCDVYSYGILLLEMFTGKIPTDDMFKDGQNLDKLAEMASPEQVMEIVDQVLLFKVEDEEATSSNSRTQAKMEVIQKCLILIFRIGVACSME